MEWLSDNWILLALFGGMAALHLVGHRRGGGHSCCGGGAHGHGENDHSGKKPNAED